MLEVSGLNVTIEGKPILNDMSLSLSSGSLMALLGPSGSGKSSLIRSIIGLTPSSAGTISMNGSRCQNGPRSLIDPSQRGMAYLFQEYTLVPHLSVKANITLGLVDPKAHKDKLNQMCGMLGIEHLFKRDIDGLSGGEQQRVALARTLMLSPQLVLLDEPFSNLDRLTKESLLADIKALLRETNTAAILATHDQREAFYFADEMVVLKQGHVAAQGASQALYQSPPDEWVARFTGESNILDASQVNAIFPGQLMNPTSGVYMIRPEQVSLQKAEESQGAVGTVKACEFYGFYRRIRVSCSVAGKAVEVVVLSTQPHTYQVGDTLTLTLHASPVRLS